MVDDRLLQGDDVRGLQWIGLVVGKSTVEVEIQRDDLDRKGGQAGGSVEHRRHGQSSHAVAGIHDDTDRADLGEIDQRPQVGRVVGDHIERSKCARLRDRLDRTGEIGLRAVADRFQPGVETDALRLRPTELDAVVAGRVVARGEHRSRGVEVAGREVGLIGRAQSNRDHVSAPSLNSHREGGSKPRRRVAHVVPDHDILARSLDLIDERSTESLDDLRGELGPHETAHVVGLDEWGEINGGSHAANLPRRFTGRAAEGLRER